MAHRRWIVLGAGAVGGVIGGRLHQGGAEVVFIARGDHGRALQSDGLLLRDPDEDVRLPIPTVATAAEVGWRDGDVVVLATKTQDVPAALDAVLDAAGDGVPVVCATNGLAAERMALRWFSEVHGVCLMLPGTHLEPGVVEAASAPCSGVLDIGLATGGSDMVDEELSAALRAGRFVADPHPDVLVRKRCKLLLNLFNVLDAACGADPGIGPLAEAAKAEGVAVFTAAGWSWSSDEEDAARRADHIKMRRIDGKRRGGGSTWQSLARGSGSTEADYLNGEISLLGRLHGVPTPVNAGLQRLARELAAARTPPGSLTAAEVESRLAAWST
jgi:2-dehydropantoate 2-reductase